MKKRSRHMLILAEIIGFFMILMGVLALITRNSLFSKVFFVLFLMAILAAVMFVIFLVLAIKQHKV